MTHQDCSATEQAWDAVGGAPRLLDRVSYVHADGALPSRLPVLELARATVAVCSLAAAELAARRSGGDVPAVRVHDGAVATAFTSERHLRVDGRPGATFAPLSGFWRTADGWVRTHANYPHHRDRLLSALGLPDAASADDLSAALAVLRAEDIQERLYAAGGLAVAVRTAGEWAAHPAGRAAAAQPLVSTLLVPGAGSAYRERRPLPPGAVLPAAGVRVLDLTRVIAGPVATRTLALLGAEVLRIDSPRLPESADAQADTGFGKRSARLDLASAADRAVFDELLGSADVVVTGYRPGALDAYGVSAPALLERRPDLIVAQLSAWGTDGPWAGRRGFDSLVQAASGIGALEAGPDARPGALPAQALDHGTGYLIAAAVLRALTAQHDVPGSRVLRFSLAGTAAWLTRRITPEPLLRASADPYTPAPWLTETNSPSGRIVHARSPLSFTGSPADWPSPPSSWGTDTPAWL